MPFQAIKPKNITIDLVGARDRNRTGTAVTRRGILSPLCLPISPPGRVSWGLGFGLMQQRAAIYYCADAAAVVIVTFEWRRGSESNRRSRICNPVHNHSATAP